MAEQTDIAAIEQTIAQHFQCQRCRHLECNARRITASTDDRTRMYAGQEEQFLAVSCGRCGMTDLFDLTVLLSAPHSAAFLYQA